MFNDPGGVLYCSFIRDALTTIVVPGVEDEVYVDFDLNNEAFYVLAATGRTNEDGELTKHASKGKTPAAMNLGDYPFNPLA